MMKWLRRASLPIALMCVSAAHARRPATTATAVGNACIRLHPLERTNAALGLTPDDNTRLELTIPGADGKAAYADRGVDGAKFARDNYGLKFNKQHIGGLLDGVEAQVYYNYVDHVMDSLQSTRRRKSRRHDGGDESGRKTTGGRFVATMQMAMRRN